MTVTTLSAAPRVISAHELDRLAAVFADAFLDDPVTAWFLPGGKNRHARMQRFFSDVVFRATLPHGAVQTIGDVLGGAVWLPPGAAQSSLGEQLRLLPYIARAAGRHTLRGMRGMSAMEAKHPREPHWYLWFMGIRPGLQSEGLGRRLLQPMLDLCDEQRMPAYLEATTPRTRDAAALSGFEVIDVLSLPSDGPDLHLMWRDPR